MVKLLLGASVLAALLVPPTGVRFEKEGVRVGEALVQGPALELKQVEAGVFLASGNVVEPISFALTVEMAAGRTLILEPGVRAARAEGGIRLSTHGGKKLRLEGDGKVFKLGASETLSLTEKGWAFGGEVLAAGSIRVGLQQEDKKEGEQAAQQGDPDQDLEAMRRAASRIQSRRRTARTGKQRMRRVFPTDPTVASEAVDGKTLKPLTQVTPIGF